MGWTFTSKRGQTTKEFFEKEFNYVRDNGMSGTIIRFSATWTTAYMAYEIKTPKTETEDAKREVIAIVCLTRHVPNDPCGYNFGYKDMTESMGPCERKCPGTILALLTPTTSEYAIEWRKDCQARIDKRKAAPKVKAGDWVKFAKSITFRSGAELDTLQWVKGSTFKRYYDLYRLPNWREKEYVNLGQLATTP
jgi:hypothetical protein